MIKPTPLFSKYTLSYLILIILCYLILFAHIERIPLNIWDEAHRAVNAQEILENNEWIIITFENSPDLYGTKPPMLVWLQALFMKLLGSGELAVRLPSALAGLGICITMFFGLKNYLRNSWGAILSVLVLLSSYGFIDRHGSRSGDTDVLLTFFIVMSSMNFFRYVDSGKGRYLYYMVLFFAFGVLTKSVTIFMMVPGFFLYALFYKKVRELLTEKHLYYSCLLFILLSAWYYIVREIQMPGYLDAVWENELAGRYFKVNDGHNESKWFYLSNIYNGRFIFFYVLLGSPLVFLFKNERIKKLTLFSLILSGSFLLLISFSKTKLAWYDIPTYPFLSVIAALVIYCPLYLILNVNFVKSEFLKISLLHLIIISIFFIPIKRNIGYTFNPELKPWENKFYYISYYLRSKIEKEELFNGVKIIEPEDFGLRAGIPFHRSHILFYSNILEQQGSQIEYKKKEQVEVGDLVLTNSNICRNYLNKNFLCEEIDSYYNVYTYRLHYKE